MKRVSIWVLGFFGVGAVLSSAWAADGLIAVCSTQSPPLTWMVRGEGQKISVGLLQEGGESDLYLWSGPVTEKMLPWLERKAQSLRKLGSALLLQWDRSRCERKSQTRFECFGGDEFHSAGGRGKAWSFYTSNMTEEMFTGTQESVGVYLTFDLESVQHEFKLRFRRDECFFASGGLK